MNIRMVTVKFLYLFFSIQTVFFNYCLSALASEMPPPSFLEAKLKSVSNGVEKLKSLLSGVESDDTADLEITLNEFANHGKFKTGNWETAGENQWIYRIIFTDQLTRLQSESSLLFVKRNDNFHNDVLLTRWVDGSYEYNHDEIFTLAMMVSKEIISTRKFSPKTEADSGKEHPPDDVFEIYISNNIESINEFEIMKDDISYSGRDFNGDGKQDWSLWDKTKCGSGGCTGDIYILKNGKYCYAGYDNFNKILNSKIIISHIDCANEGAFEIK